MVSVVIGAALSGFAMVVTARPGAKLHIGYPTLLRSSFGMWGSKIFVGLRGGVAAIWFGIQVGALVYIEPIEPDLDTQDVLRQQITRRCIPLHVRVIEFQSFALILLQLLGSDINGKISLTHFRNLLISPLASF